MSTEKIQTAFEKKLLEITPAIDTAYENVSFKPRKEHPFQSVYLQPKNPENPTFGDTYYREVGEFLIFLNYPNKEGTNSARQRAEAIRQMFSRGSTLVEDGLEIIIKRTPTIAGGITSNDRYILPVRIEYFASVLTG